MIIDWLERDPPPNKQLVTDGRRLRRCFPSGHAFGARSFPVGDERRLVYSAKPQAAVQLQGVERTTDMAELSRNQQTRLPRVSRWFLVYCYWQFILPLISLFSSNFPDLDLSNPLTVFGLVLNGCVIALHHARSRFAYVGAVCIVSLIALVKLFGYGTLLWSWISAGYSPVAMLSAFLIRIPMMAVLTYFAVVLYKHRRRPSSWIGVKSAPLTLDAGSSKP